MLHLILSGFHRSHIEIKALGRTQWLSLSSLERNFGFEPLEIELICSRIEIWERLYI